MGKKRYLVTLVLAALVFLLGGYSLQKGNGRSKLVYADSLDEVAAEVNGEELTLRELAFYVAYEESEVQKQAVAYDPEDTAQFWKLHTDGVFVRVAARNAAIQMAVHDEIFYELALSAGMELSEAEEEMLRNSIYDFWIDLTEDGKEKKLGVTREDIAAAMCKIAYAQKYQTIYAQLQDQNYENYDFAGDAYQVLLEEQDYRIVEKVWDRIDFGNVTLEH